MVTEEIHAYGHPNIQATHPTTLMFTKDRHLSQQGDCVVAVAADKALADLSADFKDQLRKPNTAVAITIEAGGLKEVICAVGSPKLCLCHATDMVVRKSDFISSRTLAIGADKSSLDLSRELVEKLRNPDMQVRVTLTVTCEC